MIRMLIILFVLSFGAQAQERFASDQERKEIHDWLNGVRAVRGLDSVKIVDVPEIVEFNNRYASYICNEKFKHSRQGYEVIAMTRSGFEHAIGLWLTSKPHFAAITNKSVKYVVVGAYTKDNLYYVVANYFWNDPNNKETIKKYKKSIKLLEKGKYF